MVGDGNRLVDHLHHDRGIATIGALGYLIDRLLGIGHVFLPIGFIVGGGLGTYIIWLRYGKGEDDGT